MTRAEMDNLKVGDAVEVKSYSTALGDFEWVPTVINHVYTCADGGKFAHGGYHSVTATVNGFTETLTPDLTRFPISVKE